MELGNRDSHDDAEQAQRLGRERHHIECRNGLRTPRLLRVATEVDGISQECTWRGFVSSIAKKVELRTRGVQTIAILSASKVRHGDGPVCVGA